MARDAAAAGREGRAGLPVLAIAILGMLLGLAAGLPTKDAKANSVTRVLRVPSSSYSSSYSNNNHNSNSNSNTNNNNNNNNSNNGNGLSVSFVPLFSILANFLPRLLARFAIQPQGSRSLSTSPSDSRELLLKSNGIFCSPEKVGRWKDLSDKQQFYECRMKADSPEGCQAFLTSSGSMSKVQEKQEKHNIERKENIIPIVMDTYSTSCVTVTTYKCPNNSEFDEKLKICIAETQPVLHT